MPEGATVVFSAHGVAPVVHEEAPGAALKTIDATCPLVTKVHQRGRAVRRRRLRHPAHRPRGPRGGRGHRRRGARAHHLVDGPDDVDQRRRSATPRRWSGCRRPRCRSTRRWRRCAGCASGSRAAGPAERRHLLRHPEPPGRGEGDRRRRRPGDRRRLAQLLQLGAPRRGRARARRPGRRTSSTTPPRSTRPGSTGVTTVGVTCGASVPEILVRDVLG